MNDLTGACALVTGASAPNGIGRATAMRLAQDGARVVVTDVAHTRRVDGRETTSGQLLADVVAQIIGQGGEALDLTLDVTDADDIAACLETVTASFGTVDILVNNAGSLEGSDAFLSTTPAQWERNFRVNLLGPMMMAQGVIPGMQKAGGGRIINIGSTASLGAEPSFGAYTAMKHGLVGLSKTLAAEFGVNNILCNTVCPGYIATDMHMAANHRIAGETGLTLEEIKARRYAGVALRDAGLPVDVANAVAYLAGSQARYVTGISLPVTGGVPPGI